MIWGLKLKSNKKYSQNVETGFHLSMAALDTHTANDDDVQVMVLCGDESYLLCTLNKNSTPQCQLNLDFTVGDQVTFISKGNGSVSLTGSFLPDDDDMFGPADSDDEEGLGLDAGDDSEDEPMKANGGIHDKKPRLEKKKALSKPMIDDEADSDEDSDDESFVAGDNLLEADSDEDDDDDDDDDDEDDDDEDDEDENDSDDDDQVPQPQAKKQKIDKQQNGQAQQNGKQKKDKENKKEKQQQQQPQKKSPKRTLQGGVIVEDLKVGNGAEAKNGKKVQVYYEGRLKDNNRMFDSAKAGPGFKFGLGRGEVIKGWDVGVAGMKVGGKRRLTIPANMGYGAKGSPPTIPANATLVFDVELKNVLN